ncbi:MAG: ABC transporter permease [Candidatus Baldrarchaeia archaeon]
MKDKMRFFTLLLWEFDENFSFPVFEVLVFVAIFFLIGFTSQSMHPYMVWVPVFDMPFYGYLDSSLTGCAFISMFFTGFLFARNIAGKFSNREMKTLLSYPVKRRDLFLSKFFANFIVLYLLFGSVLVFDAVLTGFSVFSPLVGFTLLSLLIGLMFLCSVSMTISLLIKNEALSFFGVFFLIYGLEYYVSGLRKPYNTCFSVSHGSVNIAAYLLRMYYSGKASLFSYITFKMFLLSLGFQISIIVILMVVSFVYFVYFLEVD